MAMVRTVICGVCGKKHTEENPNVGWPGWGQLLGVAIDDDVNPYLCPDHLANVADLMDGLKNGVD